MSNPRYIETDSFDFEFLSKLGERESWRKELHRPIYHVHKWWAKRLGSVFRGILLGSVLPAGSDLNDNFYSPNNFNGMSVFDPFMGSGTTVGEACKLGMTAYGQDINPVAAEAVRVAFSDIDENSLIREFRKLERSIGKQLRSLYLTKDSQGREADVLYYFWVMQTKCLSCTHDIDLFSSRIIAKNAYPLRKPDVRVLCPGCGVIFNGLHGSETEACPNCLLEFDPTAGSCKGGKAFCSQCSATFSIIDSLDTDAGPPAYRLYGKLVLNADGNKEYLAASSDDLAAYDAAICVLRDALESGVISLPHNFLTSGHNTDQAIKYGFRNWIHFFNDRQLLALGLLQRGISEIEDQIARDALLTLFSGTLEFNNRFASYKGEGTGAVRHMFSHHVLKPERTPIEANVWGTARSSGSFSTLFETRLLRALEYKRDPKEIGEKIFSNGSATLPFFEGRESSGFDEKFRSIKLACGDSSQTSFADRSIDLVVTDPPFFDNVHYSELADFFFAWQSLTPRGFIRPAPTTRSRNEVQDANSDDFARKLRKVFAECHRILKDDGLLVFTYHHSRKEGWKSIGDAILGAGFIVVNSHPVKAEMSVATPKNLAKDPIQLDIILVCRKVDGFSKNGMCEQRVLDVAREKIDRMKTCGFKLSANDEKIIIYGQSLTLLRPSNIGRNLEASFESVFSTASV